jgi:hypothetical protein
MKENTKVTKAVSKAAREIPIIAWAVEVDGKIALSDVYTVREEARYIRNERERYQPNNKLHVRKIAMQVIPGR